MFKKMFYVCSLCLGVNSRMYNLVNTYLQETYETLTGIKLKSSDTFLCFLCRSMLMKSHRLREMAAKSSILLTDMLKGSLMQTEESILSMRKLHNLEHNLCINNVGKINIESCDVSKMSHDTIFEEKVDNDLIDREQEYKVKVEDVICAEHSFCIQNEINDLSAIGDIGNLNCLNGFDANKQDSNGDEHLFVGDDDDCKTLSDSDDDVPLQKIIKENRGIIDNTTLLTNKKVKGKSNQVAKVRKKNIKKKITNIEDDISKGFKSGYAREIILTMEQQLQEMADRSGSLNYQNSPFKCTLCYKGFVDQVAFDNHKTKHSESAGSFECEICKMRYETERQHKEHKVRSHERQYECVKCLHRSHTANQAREHEKWHRGITYKCELCGMDFRKSTSYLTHVRKLHPSEYVCAQCGDSFVGRHGLLMHRSKAHPGDEEIMPKPKEPNPETYCKECRTQFASSEAWRRHILTSIKHSVANEKSTICPICRESCDVATYADHMSTHRSTLKRRTAPRQNNARVSCHTCGDEFTSWASLQLHAKRKHLGIKYDKNIICEICGKKCSSHAFLQYHQRTHTGEKPHPCQLCDKRFADKNQLRIHTRTHTGEKPYCCSECGRRFAQKPALNRHHRVHSGLKPYECQYCSKAFSQSNSMKLHVKTVHLKQPARERIKPKLEIKLEVAKLQIL